MISHGLPDKIVVKSEIAHDQGSRCRSPVAPNAKILNRWLKWHWRIYWRQVVSINDSLKI